MCKQHYLSQHDLAVLHRFVREHGGDAVGRLVKLLGATIALPETEEAPRRVGLGATVHYRSAGTRETGSIVIACPYDANALLARVTIPSPLALGLLGHAEGGTVGIDLPHARSLPVEIVGVEAPPRAPLSNPVMGGGGRALHQWSDQCVGPTESC